MKSRYALKALIDLSINSTYEQVALKSIAKRNDISLQYLEQVFASLRKAELVKSIKGSGGGYLLAKSPDKITVSDIIKAIEGDYLIEEEKNTKSNEHDGSTDAIQKLVIDEVNKNIQKAFESVTLNDLEKHFKEVENYNTNMYYI